MTREVQLIGISNAIVDILAHVDDPFLDSIGAPRGSMTLIDEAKAHDIYQRMGPATEMSGGSVANTIAGFANLGGDAAYIGRVKDDQFGDIFVHDMRSLGVDVRLEPAQDGAATARSHVLISSDGQRTMQTYLGACTELGVADVTPATIGQTRVILLEGYVWDIPEGPALAAEAFAIGKATGAKVALSLSDSFCVERHQEAFMEVVIDDADIVFADEDEVMALYKADSLDAVLAAIKGSDTLFVITCAAQGSVVVRGEERVQQDAIPIDEIIDTTGAGDAYTAAFLYGWTTGKPLAECARLGTWCATAIIQKLGARLEKGILDDYTTTDN